MSDVITISSLTVSSITTNTIQIYLPIHCLKLTQR
jgi:hypothetical protein